jgi:hypothetical protein
MCGFFDDDVEITGIGIRLSASDLLFPPMKHSAPPRCKDNALIKNPEWSKVGLKRAYNSRTAAHALLLTHCCSRTAAHALLLHALLHA